MLCPLTIATIISGKLAPCTITETIAPAIMAKDIAFIILTPKKDITIILIGKSNNIGEITKVEFRAEIKLSTSKVETLIAYEFTIK